MNNTHVITKKREMKDLPVQGIGVIIFCSVCFLSKKVNKPVFLEKNRNQFKPTSSVRFDSAILGKKPVQIGLARFFFRFWFGSVRFF
jgi:hypothetical protein